MRTLLTFCKIKNILKDNIFQQVEELRRKLVETFPSMMGYKQVWDKAGNKPPEKV